MSAVIAVVILALYLLRSIMQVQFYKGYFEQKQVNRGKNLREVLKEEFPRIWWLL